MSMSDANEDQMNEMLDRISYLEIELAEAKMVIANKRCPNCSFDTSPPNAAAARASAIANGLITPSELFGPAYSPYSPGCSPRYTPRYTPKPNNNGDQSETPNLGDKFGDTM